MASQPTYLTREGYKKIKEEHEYLSTVKRREISKAINPCVNISDSQNDAMLYSLC